MIAAEGEDVPPHSLTHFGPLKIEHTETDSVDPRSNGRPPAVAAVPKSAVSALVHGQGWRDAFD